ncbi:hypothetical protein K440DRAFT_663010 [Wilcoxina mikolae CBS 423.85]|nr:hypothetical protein K440DRAFT_663010 [Wilcoxina mikolae CBS 423.85]
MKFNIAILTLFVTGALPPDFSLPFAQDAYRKAMDNGVDPDGPMPEDFTENNGRWISFAEGSKFALWAAAQSAVVHGNSKRAPDGRCILDIMEYTGPNCDGPGTYHPDISIPGWYPSGQESHSLQIRNCNVDPNNGRLWLKGKTCDDDLRHYVYGEPGCAGNLETFTACGRFQSGAGSSLPPPSSGIISAETRSGLGRHLAIAVGVIYVIQRFGSVINTPQARKPLQRVIGTRIWKTKSGVQGLLEQRGSDWEGADMKTKIQELTITQDNQPHAKNVRYYSRLTPWVRYVNYIVGLPGVQASELVLGEVELLGVVRLRSPSATISSGRTVQRYQYRYTEYKVQSLVPKYKVSNFTVDSTSD